MRTVLASGFRPFFALAACWAVIAVPLWLLWLAAFVSWKPPLPPTSWHAHAMTVGFAGAVLAGFLLTAVRVWTGRPTTAGPGLALLVLLWIAGRVASLVDLGMVGRLLDLAFLPAVAVVIAVPILRARSSRNAAFPVALGMLALANGLIWAGRPGATMLAVDAVIWVLVVFGGRIVPLFTRNALSAADVRSDPISDAVSRVGVAGVVFADALVALGIDLGTLPGALGVVAGVATLWRMRRWGSTATWRRPILWVLHLGFAWIGVGLVLRGATGLGVALPPSLAVHVLTVGGLGTMSLGMMARVSLGHTGRPLRVPAAVAVGFGLVTLAALLRVVAAWLAVTPLLHTSGVLFAAAFATFLVSYAPILAAARVDGGPG